MCLSIARFLLPRTSTPLASVLSSLWILSLLPPPPLLSAATPGIAPCLLSNDVWAVSIDPATLRIVAEPANRPSIPLSAAVPDMGPARRVLCRDNAVTWEFPREAVTFSLHLENRDLAVSIRMIDPGSFTWPAVPMHGQVKALIWPHWEGRYIPLADARWREHLVEAGPHDTLESLSMPFWGLDCGEYSVTYIATNPYNNEIRFAEQNDGLLARFTHEFPPNHAPREYGLVVSLGDNTTPVGPALRFRRWLVSRNEFVGMDRKHERIPNVDRLLGAAHVYLWGDAYLSHRDIRSPTNRWTKVWKPLCRQLIAESESAQPTVGKHIKSLMRTEPWDAVVEMTRTPYDYAYLQRNIADELSRILGLPEFYDESAWHGIALPDEATTLLARGRESLPARELLRMNGLLLRAAYPEFLAPVDEWGDGVSVAMLRELRDAGFDRLRICLDGWQGAERRPEVAEEADRMGYLFGTYDSFHSIHDPKYKGTDASWPTAQFGQELYENGGITLRYGRKKCGFKQRGFLLSPIAARPYVEERVNANFRHVPYTYYFVDCDAYGQVFDDYTPGRQVTQHEDAMARNDRLAWIRDTQNVVIGSEGGSAYAAHVIHVAEGMFLSAFGWGDPDLKDKHSEYYEGAYYPPDGPAVFFKPSKLKEEYRYFHLDPRFRLPLYQTVFHDSVVTASHWGKGNLKYPDEADLIHLTQLLYQVPPLYHVNTDEFPKRRDAMKAQYDIFSPLHRELGFSRMTDFAWLTADRMVQRTVFDGRVEIIANFSAAQFDYEGTSVPPLGILVHRRDSGTVNVHALSP